MTNRINLSQNWVFPLASALLILPIALLDWNILDYTHGKSIYPLDDAYIHMGIAKNIVVNHTWGICGTKFVSAASSLLYPIMLAGSFVVFGFHEIIPLLINCVAGLFLLRVIQIWLIKRQATLWTQIATLSVVIFFTPLHILIMTGMEHTLQTLFSFLFIYEFCAWITPKKDNKQFKVPYKILLLAILVTTTRYEGAFIIVVASSILLYLRKPGQAIMLGLVAAAPIILFGLISLAKGNFFLPNSVLLKSTTVPLSASSLVDFLTDGIFQKLYYSLQSVGQVATDYILIIAPATFLLLTFLKYAEPENKLILLFISAVALLHLLFASTIWFYRYEAYLVACPVPVLGLLGEKYAPSIAAKLTRSARYLAIIVIIYLSLPFFLRGRLGYYHITSASMNIYDHNYQMANFLKSYYDTTTIGVNDLGTTSFLHKGKLIDYWGLANIEAAKAKRNNYYDAGFLDQLTKKEGVRIAVVYDRLYDPQLLNQWHKVAMWQIDNRIVSGDSYLSFYAVDSTLALDLKKHLIEYKSRLSSHESLITF